MAFNCTGEHYSKELFIYEGVIPTVIGTFGIISNTAAVYYFGTKKRWKQTFYGISLASSLVDLFFIALFIPVFSIPALLNKYHSYQTWTLPIVATLYTSNIFITIVLSMERYLIICKPYSNDISSKCFVIPALVLAALINVPRFFEFTAVTLKCAGKNETFLNFTDMRKNYYYKQIYRLWLPLIFQGAIPIVILLILNISIIQEMRKYSRKEKNDKDEHARREVQVHMAEINLILVGIFIICSVVRCLPNICDILWVRIVFIKYVSK